MSSLRVGVLGWGAIGSAVGERLVAGAHSPVHILRLNEAEAISVAGREFIGRMGTTDLATKLVELEVAEVVIIARGSDGSIMASEKGVWHCRPPDVPVQSKVGAGDSFVAAFTMALLRDEPLPIAHAHGTAAASAAVKNVRRSAMMVENSGGGEKG